MDENRPTDDRRDEAAGRRTSEGSEPPDPRPPEGRTAPGGTGTAAGRGVGVTDSASAGNGQRSGHRRRPGGAGSGDDAGDRTDGSSGLVAVEEWTPPSPASRESGSVRGYLAADESLAVIDRARLLGDRSGPATVGLTDDRLLVVTDDGFVGVGLDRLCSVRSHLGSTLGVRGRDARLLGGAGYLLAVIGFLGVLAVAANPLSPALALAAAGGALLVDVARGAGGDAGGRTLAAQVADADRFDAAGRALLDVERRLAGVERRVAGSASDEPLAVWGAGAAAVLPLLALVALEGGVAAPLFALLTVGGLLTVVYAVRHSDEFDGIELVRRRRRTVSATVDDGSVVTVRTHPDSPLDRELAARAQAPATPRSGRTGDD